VKIVIGFFAILFILSLIAGFLGLGFGMMGGMMGGMMMMGGFGMLLPILLVGLIIYFIFRSTENKDNEGYIKGDSQALDDLDRRYAKGELSRESYLLIKKDILKSHK
jgi:putative membrane protein